MGQPMTVLPGNQVAELIPAAQRQFALFLGAGASCSSGVDSASAMIREWRSKAHHYSGSAEPADDWCRQQAWYGKDHEYSELFELVHPNAQARQTYIERKIERAFPGWGYLYLANLIANDWFNVVLTTNFDDLLSKALSIYTDYVPVVCAADSEVLSVSLTSRRAKIIKLHGDYLFRRLKNTVKELKQLDPNMKLKFDQVAQNLGLLVLGYGGRDHSVMSLLEGALVRDDNFGPGIYWGLWRDEAPSPMVDALARAHPDRFHLFRYDDFDVFVASLHAECRVDLPAAVLEPYDALRTKLVSLIRDDAGAATDVKGIRTDRAQLQERLDRPWAQPDSAELLLAQLALTRRDPTAALHHVTGYAKRHANDSQALTVWASALMQRSEDEGSDADREQAVAKLQQAVRIDGDNLAARYGLVTIYLRREMDVEAIAAAEELLARVPKDKYLRASLAQLYLKKGRVAEACAAVQECLRRDPSDANLHQLWAHLMVRNGNTAAALKAIERAIELNPRNAAFHVQRGQILATTMRVGDAVAAFEEATRLDPDDPQTRLALARCHMAQGAGDAAIAQARVALQGNPDSVEATGLLGELHGQRGESAQALEQFDRLVRMTPEDARAWSSRGQVLMQLNRPADAERDLLKSVKLNPKEPNMLARLAWLYRMTGRTDKLQAVMGDLYRISPQAAQMLQMQLQAGGPGLPGAPAAGVLQRFIDALR